MNSYPAAPPDRAQRARAPQRPAALLAAVYGGVLVAALTVITQLIALMSGKGAIDDAIRAELGADANTFAELFDAAVDEAYQTLQVRAVLGILVAALVLLFALMSARGGLGARITLAVFLGIGALLMILSVSDVFPGASKVSGMLSILLALGVVVLLFMPAIGRYHRMRTDVAGARRQRQPAVG